jgi:RNA polymerase sigma-70 factor (ECF subfamily)
MRHRMKPSREGLGLRQDGRSVFERCVLPLRTELMRKALRITGDPVDAEDLVQESLLKALGSVDSLEDPSRARSWVYRIMHNTFATLCRRNARKPSVPLEPSEMDAMESSSARRSADLQFDLERAIVGLDKTFQDAVVLCDVRGFSYEEAASTIGCPVGTLMSRLYRGRRRLRATLDYESLFLTA